MKEDEILLAGIEDKISQCLEKIYGDAFRIS